MKKKNLKAKKESAASQEKVVQEATAFMLESAASTKVSNVRRNIAADIERVDRFTNIRNGIIPFRYNPNGTYNGSSSMDIREAAELCQKCYWNVALFRNIIDLMTEFSVTKLMFKGGSSNSRNFFGAWANKINMWDFQNRFYREYYRGGNVFIHRFDATIQSADIKKISQVFGNDNPISSIDTTPYAIPAKYVILNPADIQILGTANFSQGSYFKVLSEYEVAQLKKPQNDEDKAMFDALPPEVQKQIKDGSRRVLLPLTFDKTCIVFYNKQDYEPFAVPMGYPVLEDINAKIEMKKIDMAIARTMQQIILLVTSGDEPEKGGINKENISLLRKLFENQSVGRVLVADYTTKAEWKIPEIGNLLDPKKYEILDRDINIGLNNIFGSDEKFANQAQKVEVFISRLEQGRQSFLNNFLIPEIKRIAKALGFKNFPTPYFEDIKLKDNANNAKLFTQLVGMGVMTPEQGFKAIETNTFPDPATMVQEMQDYKSLRDKGLYVPLIGGAPAGNDVGNPGGTPTGPKKVSPIGTKAEEKFDIVKIKENLILIQELKANLELFLKKKNKIKKLNEIQKDCLEQITEIIVANEEVGDWNSKIEQYCNLPVDTNPERIKKINQVAANHQIEPYLASILFASKADNDKTV